MFSISDRVGCKVSAFSFAVVPRVTGEGTAPIPLHLVACKWSKSWMCCLGTSGKAPSWVMLKIKEDRSATNKEL